MTKNAVTARRAVSPVAAYVLEHVHEVARMPGNTPAEKALLYLQSNGEKISQETGVSLSEIRLYMLVIWGRMISQNAA